MNKALAYIGIALLIGGCGSSSSDTKDINVTDYLPATSQSKDFFIIENGDLFSYVEEVTVDSNKITITVKDKISRIYTINDSNITLDDEENNATISLNKYIDVGDTLYSIPTETKVEDIKSSDNTILGSITTEITQYCKLNQKLPEFEKNSIKYTGDILEFKCTRDEKKVTNFEDTTINSEIYDISYFYLQRDKGLIANIDDDCLVDNDQGQEVIDDRVNSSECKSTNYIYKFYKE